MVAEGGFFIFWADEMVRIRQNMPKTRVHADERCEPLVVQALLFLILKVPAYDASFTAYKFSQFKTYSLSR